jgi:N-dimethylarginine dimethylaminohydrolase
MGATLNQQVLMSGAEHFDVIALNAYSQLPGKSDRQAALSNVQGIQLALEIAGIKVRKIPAPAGCMDGVFTANWAFCHEGTAVMASLPGPRQTEEPYAEQVMTALGMRVVKAPYRFSGQGDTLLCGTSLFVASGYRSDPRMADFLAETFPHLQVIPVQTVPLQDKQGKDVINPLSGWPDSYFYDVDLALSVLRDDLIGWCPEAFTTASQQAIRALPLEKIEVSYDEAVQGMACNLVSTGTTVIMSPLAPAYQKAIEAHGLQTITPDITEIAKGGGSIRCTTLTISN